MPNKRVKQQPENNTEKLLSRLIDLLESSIIVDLAHKGFAYNTIQKIVGGDIHRIAKLLKPIKKEIQKLRR
jgi:hypothetical protein